MIASTQTRNTEIFASIAALVFKILSRKKFFINRKEQKLKKEDTFKKYRKIHG